ncbi:C signal [Tritonibacter multivorans]|uniref:C signal n=1 Tax=Tritonibacter multivorans TaxID=928856 RepID=A0A0P1GGG0_9RHOB|nr:SDR family oxidoreductase [Tritonibacter multivorans]MDA7419434.1 SDR family oxidoreductase [Tritonibacter multivorans]CUH75455.1 C signal [Tritonibacter multivorans]SFC67374.1 NAD(P)-dependent dehydrogenase, short-chain alcohol dehydrogenase family [Tritonibacter multivorans]
MHVVITGTSRGIGRELARQMREGGHEVTGTSRDHSSGTQLDVTDPGQQARFAARIKGEPVDLLICNAGVYIDKAMGIADYSAEVWAKSLAVNVTGVFLTVQAMLPNLRLSHDPKIVIISSQMASHERAPGGSYAYRASKAAALNIGRNMATDLAPEGISVGIYHPGWVQTDMGGQEAEITVQDCAAGLIREFDALSPETTGCFRTWDGHDHAY